ncbi:MAG TPA: glycosyltransferase family 1 protein [Bryobacteraceae bacterium]|nr:glycosyltransferase family 1 protein [Bryobacteraceae bacterium]
MRIALDATYSVGRELSGVGVYSNEMISGLALRYPEEKFVCCYRAHRYLRAHGTPLPPNCSRGLLQEYLPIRAELFHGLNQRLPKRCCRKKVCTFHDLFVFTGEYSTPEFRKRFIQQAKHAASVSDRIICVSEFTARQVQELLGVERERLRVVHHGVHFPPADASPREKLILHVGAIQQRKNISRLIGAFETLPAEWKLVLAGSAGYGAEAIANRIDVSPARPRIQITGYVTTEELRRLYSRAGIFAFPSLDEGFGIPVLEAMAAGVPVVTSNTSALPEVAGDAAILVDPVDESAIATALRLLVEDEILRDRLRAKGQLRAASFTWKNAVEKTCAVYKELL